MRLGLRAKFFLYSNTLIAVTMGLVTVLSVMTERRARYEAIERRARSITEALAIPITDSLMYEELGLITEGGLIQSYIDEIVDRNRDLVRYVFVTDQSGRITHSNRWRQLGTVFPRALSRTDVGSGVTASKIAADGGREVLEVRTTLNVSTRFWGSLAAGFSLAEVDEAVHALARRVALVALALILANSVLTAIYVETLIRPIIGLNRTMKRAATGDFTARADERPRDEVGELGQAFNRMMDELEEAQAREQLRQSQLLHTEKMAAVGTLAAGVAHEVSNPLAGVLACLESLQGGLEDPETVKRYTAMITDGLERIDRTVQNLLGFARQREMQAEPTSINHNLQHVAELANYQLRRGGVALEWDLAEEEPVILGDHFQMEQLFLNLVLNAVQAMPEGGTLTLRSRRRGETVIVEVEDTGEGVPPENLDRIFDPFFTTREIGEGTGLGLAVSDTIARAHGGRIEVKSIVGKGSVFRVILSVRRSRKDRGGKT